MFTTQLSGLFTRISDKQEFEIEDAARLLAQAAVGEGHILIKGYKEMNAVISEAIYGEEPLKQAREFQSIDKVDDADRVLLITRFSNDPEALELAQALRERFIPFVVISGDKKEEQDLKEYADVHLDTKLIKGMLPGEELGERMGFPSSIAALYLYFLMKFIIDEMLTEYEE